MIYEKWILFFRSMYLLVFMYGAQNETYIED